MRKGFLAICLVLAVAIVLVAGLVPSCAPTTGTIEVKATLCGVPWPTQGTGALNYTLTPGTGSPISGTSVPATHSRAAPGSWTCGSVSGGPAGAHLDSIKPSATQSVSAGGTITFTLDFELDQDAGIQWLWWTQDGLVWQSSTLETVPCHIIDAHFKQWVDGCPGYNVTMNETSWLMINYVAGPAPVQFYVANDPCAVNKTPTPQGLPPVKKSQVPSFGGKSVEGGWLSDPIIPGGPPILLDVETAWQLVKCLNYTKSINWFGISKLVEPPVVPHPCVLFELLLPPGLGYQFQLVASAMVELVDDVDVNPANNSTTSPPLTLWVNVAGP